jgi:hypothetical protein
MFSIFEQLRPTQVSINEIEYVNKQAALLRQNYTSRYPQKKLHVQESMLAVASLFVEFSFSMLY